MNKYLKQAAGFIIIFSLIEWIVWFVSFESCLGPDFCFITQKLFYIFTLAVALVSFLLSFLILRRKEAVKVKNFLNFNDERGKKKEENKEKILKFMQNHGHIRNDDAEALLSVSDATVTRYLDELEKEGKVMQINKGSGAYYQLRA